MFSQLKYYIFKKSYILLNISYLYKSKTKYKKYYKFNIKLSLAKINKIDYLNFVEIKIRLLFEYYNYLNVFNRLKTNKLFLYRLYNYRLKFVNNVDESKLS